MKISQDNISFNASYNIRIYITTINIFQNEYCLSICKCILVKQNLLMSYKSAAAILFLKPHCIVSAIVREYSHNFQQYESHVELQIGSILNCFIQKNKYYQDRKVFASFIALLRKNFNLMNHHLQFFDHFFGFVLECKRF